MLYRGHDAVNKIFGKFLKLIFNHPLFSKNFFPDFFGLNF